MIYIKQINLKIGFKEYQKDWKKEN